MQDIGHIDKRLYSLITDQIRSSRLVLTEKSKNHIIDRRGEAFFEMYSCYFKTIAEDPDYLFKDKNHENSALACKTIQENGKHIHLVIRLAVESDDEEYENSIITAMIENDRRYQQRLRNNIPVYKKA